jgi:hypothetical protein
VETTELPERGCNECLAVGEAGDIAAEQRRAAAESAHGLSALFGGGCDLRALDQVADRDVGARTRDLDGDAAPDAARGSRDDGDLAFEQA